MKHEEKMHVWAAHTSPGGTRKTCRDHAHSLHRATSVCRDFSDGITSGSRSWPPRWPRRAMMALVKTRNQLIVSRVSTNWLRVLGTAARPQIDQGVRQQLHSIELVAGFAHRSHLLKSWEKTETWAVSTSGAHGPKIQRSRACPSYALPRNRRSRTHFSHRTALV